MSGSSLDGLDIAHVKFEEVRGKWSYEILNATCNPYPAPIATKLKNAVNLNVAEFLELNTTYGRLLGESVKGFIIENGLEHKINFVASHGHTIHHNPEKRTSFQMGDGASIAVVSGLPVISDLRNTDVALGGQGAPIVPIGDRLLFGEYSYLLNIGGIANLTCQTNDSSIAFDICVANQALNALAQKEGFAMDSGGTLAASGSLLVNVLDALKQNNYYKKAAPKSLSNEQAIELVFPVLNESQHSTADLLHTVCELIAWQVAQAVETNKVTLEPTKMLITGGGAFNNYLVQRIETHLGELNVTVEVPKPDLIKFKEAVVMALIGTLRWREENNVLSSVTGAQNDSCGGALWLP